MSGSKPSTGGPGLRRILVVIDPTVRAHPCIEKARTIALQHNSTLELFVCDTSESVPDSLSMAITEFEYRRVLGLRRLDMLEQLATPLRAVGLNVTTTTQWDASLTAAIGVHVIRTGADLVIKDTHPHLPIRRSAISHTDVTLIHQLPAPLLLVRQKPWSQPPRVAVAIDPCQPAERSKELDEALLNTAAVWSRASGTTLEVVHVRHDPAHLPGDTVSHEHKARTDRISSMLVNNLVHSQHVTADVYFQDGPVGRSLLSFASQHRADVLVMGAATRSRTINAVTGGTAAQLLEHLECDLLVVKHPGFVSSLLA